MSRIVVFEFSTFPRKARHSDGRIGPKRVTRVTPCFPTPEVQSGKGSRISQKILKCVLLFISLTPFCGCLPYTKLVTNDAKYSGNYRKGQIYELQQDAFLRNWHAYFFSEGGYHLIPNYSLQGPSPYRNLGTPSSYEEYANDPKKWAGTINGIVPKGTRLDFDELVYHWYLEGDMTYPCAIILDGKFKGKRVSLDGISRQPFSIRDPEYGKNNNYLRYLVDTNWLKESQ